MLASYYLYVTSAHGHGWLTLNSQLVLNMEQKYLIYCGQIVLILYSSFAE